MQPSHWAINVCKYYNCTICGLTDNVSIGQAIEKTLSFGGLA